VSNHDEASSFANINYIANSQIASLYRYGRSILQNFISNIANLPTLLEILELLGVSVDFVPVIEH